MSEETMKILRMLEEGKITAAEASELLGKVETLEEKESQPEPNPTHRVHFGMPGVGNVKIPPIPPIPPMPDVSRIVNDALRDAFSGMSFGAEGTPVEGAMTYQGVAFAGALLEHSDLADAKMDTDTQLEGADLRYATLADADLRGANLQGANLSYSDFRDVKLKGANLQGAQLHHGNYTDADFRDADLRGADLSLSNLADASFKHVVQPGLVLRGMNMPGVKYEGAVDMAAEVESDIDIDVQVDIDELLPDPEPMDFDEEKDLGEA